VQDEPIKPTLKVPGTQRLKLKYDEVVSSCAVNLNLRHCPTVLVQSSSTTTSIIISLVGASELSVKMAVYMVQWCKLKHGHEFPAPGAALSSFAFHQAVDVDADAC
jgi:hypothetical protein